MAIICAISSQTKAQISFAPVVGLNVAKMDVKSSGVGFSPDNVFGAHFGVVSRIPINNKLSVQSGILYSMKGFELKVQDEGMKLNLNTLEIPINITYSLSGDINEGLFALAGPYLGYAFSGKIELKSNGLTQSADLKFNYEDGINRVDFGVNFGAGYRLNNGLLIQAQYGLGLNNMVNKDVMFSELKNKVFSFTLGYFIKVKKS